MATLPRSNSFVNSVLVENDGSKPATKQRRHHRKFDDPEYPGTIGRSSIGRNPRRDSLRKNRRALTAPLNTPTYAIITVSRCYPNATPFPEDEDPFEEFEINFGDIENFEVIAPIGTGKYSIVFLGKFNHKHCAIKTLKNVPFIKIQREICLLDMISSLPHIVKTIAIVQDPLTNMISIVSEFQSSESPKTLYPKFSLKEIRILIYKLLEVLDAAHQKGIMHRDVKPGNILISSNKKDLKLIDWGLADMYYPQKAYTVRVSTMRYKAPELLLNYQYYDYGIDVWGAGCVFAEMLIRFPFFEGTDPEEMIIDVAKIVGVDQVQAYANKYGLELTRNVQSGFAQNRNSGWHKTLQGIKLDKNDENAVKLLKSLFTIDHAERITAAEALQHPFFDALKK